MSRGIPRRSVVALALAVGVTGTFVALDRDASVVLADSAVQSAGPVHHVYADPGDTYGQLSGRLTSADAVFSDGSAQATGTEAAVRFNRRRAADGSLRLPSKPNRGAAWRVVEAYARATDRSPSDVAADAISMRGDFADGRWVVVERSDISREPEARLSSPAPDERSGVVLETPAFVATLRERGGTRVGVMAWYARAQRLEWSFPGRTQGAVSGENIERKVNGNLVRGWPFTPDFEWALVQAYGFATLYRETPTWNRRFDEADALGGTCGSPSGGLLSTLWGLVETPVYANDPGCDRLHWLDGSIFRRCCDVHDQCYEAFGCSERSWWTLRQGWSCVFCNMNAVRCFSKGGLCNLCVT